jgi:hypothetical protein
MDKIYYGSFSCIDDVINDFQISDKELEGCEIIFAEYDQPDYEGYAHIIFRKGGKLYEVNGSHCSCYGLEGQWVPEETLLEALMFRPGVSKFAKANLKERFAKLIPFL